MSIISSNKPKNVIGCMAEIEHSAGHFLGKKLVKFLPACDKSPMPTKKGAIRIFRLFGIDVYLHWSWFLIVLYDIQARGHVYDSYLWNALETLGLFGIILLHEFGHALACRQVGGNANQIVLWPLGGVAYVSP